MHSTSDALQPALVIFYLWLVSNAGAHILPGLQYHCTEVSCDQTIISWHLNYFNRIIIILITIYKSSNHFCSSFKGSFNIGRYLFASFDIALVRLDGRSSPLIALYVMQCTVYIARAHHKHAHECMYIVMAN